MLIISAWNIYFIKETAEEETFTGDPVELFGADQTSGVFLMHVFAFSYSFMWTAKVIFPIYVIINLITVLKI